MKACTIKQLPREKLIEAAKRSIEVNPANAPDVSRLKQIFALRDIHPEHLAALTKVRWPVTGIKLTVGFMDNPPADLKERILSHMNAWGQYANVGFAETLVNPQVRISRSTPAPDNGYWSYLGTDILSIDADKPTMNLDGFTMATADEEFFRVVRHETGHTLGFPHEHMRSEIIDGINREKAIKYFMETQGWSRQMVIEQVLTPLDQSALLATEHADPNSIMCYWLPAEIMENGIAIPGGKDIDQQDAKFAAIVYPKS